MFGSLNDKAYFVGGVVRDELMGVPPNDVDYVIEASIATMKEHFPNLQMVGNDFPVFIINGFDVAVTRTEKSIGDGYKDFVWFDGVSIHDDLARRDFTINSIAKHVETGKILDPYNGMEDLENKRIRAFNKKVFIEDPVRILRGIRFACRFDFNIDAETKMLMIESINRLQYVTKERIVLELEKMYKQCKNPSKFFNILADFDGLKYILKPIDDMRYVTAGPNQYHNGNTAFEHTMEAIDVCKDTDMPFEAFIAVLFHDTGKASTPWECPKKQHSLP